MNDIFGGIDTPQNPNQAQPSTPSSSGLPPQASTPSASGVPNQGVPPTNAGMQPVQQKTSGLAIAALVMAIIFWPIGLILGIVALVMIGKDPNLKGKGLAIAAIIIPVVFLLVLIPLAAIAYFGVLSPGNLLPEKCEMAAGLDCTETPSSSAAAASITFPLVNSNGYAIHPLKATASSPVGMDSCTGYKFLQSKEPVTIVSNGDSFLVELNGCSGMKQAERFMVDVTVEYRSNATAMTHLKVGRLAGKVGP